MCSTLPSKNALDRDILANIAADCDLPVEAIEDVYSCSPLQIATMIETSLRAGSSTFQFVFALGPDVDETTFSKAVQETVARNQILRTRIVEDSNLGLVQAILTNDSATPCHTAEHDLDRHLQESRAKPTGMGFPLFTTAIVEHKLVLSMHHAAMDHSALTLLMTDVVATYRGQSPSPRPQYKNFVDYCYSVDDSAIEKFWAPRFKGSPMTYPPIPSGHVPMASEAFEHHLALDPHISSDAITHIASFIEAALGLTLSAYTGSDSVAIGIVLAGRTGLPGDVASTLGPTIATVPLQINASPTLTVGNIIKERTNARRELQSSPALHAGMPRIRAASEAVRAASQFQTILNVRPSLADPDSASAEIAFDQMHEPSAPFGLCLSCNLMPSCRSMILEARFDPKVLTKRQTHIMVNQFEHRLNALMTAGWDERIKALPALNKHDHQQILDWNASSGADVSQTLHDMFHQRALIQPEATAIEATVGGKVTYRELDDMSTRLSEEIRRQGVGPGSRVPIIFEKSVWTTVAMLAIMRAGGAFVPVEKSNPFDRRTELVRSVGATIVLTSRSEHASNIDLADKVLTIDKNIIESLPKETNTNETFEADPRAEDLAVVLFTSGSTGKPKGVMLEHRNLTSSLTAISGRLDWRPGRRILQFAANVWDVSLGETFGALLFGATLCVPSEDQRSSALSQYIQDVRADWIILTPTVLRTLSPDELPSLQTVVSAGEAIDSDIVITWGSSTKFRLFNGWGPCETSVMSAIAEVTTESPYPDSIGGAVGCSIWLIKPDKADDLVPIGSTGEICVVGPGVARGYLEEKIAASTAGFIKPPAWVPVHDCCSHRVFRTGDLARYNEDGSITFIGRRDNLVKVRGQRFDLGEVEAAIRGSGHIKEVYTTTKIHAGRTEVMAVVGLAQKRMPTNTAIQPLTGDRAADFASSMAAVVSYIRSKLPTYMVPTIWIAVESLPRTTSAKLDRTAVKDWLKTQEISTIQWHNQEPTQTKTPPTTPKERALQVVWAKVLSLNPEDVGRESTFLQLGGDSIRAMQAANSLRKMGLSITTADLLSDASLSSLAGTASSSAVKSQDWWLDVPGDKSSPLSAGTISGGRVEQVMPATDAQASMLAIGQRRADGYHVTFELDFSPALDLVRLRAACEAVIRHHAVLRTVFVQQGSRLYQTILEDESISRPIVAVYSANDSRPATEEFADDEPLARFQLLAGQNSCHKLLLDIHHALYDAFSLDLLFQDLGAAYIGRSLCQGPPFHSWISYCERQATDASIAFWRTKLQGSHMSHLTPPYSNLMVGPPLTERHQFCARLSAIEKSSLGTPSTIVKAAWAIALSIALQEDDVVFGEVNAGRFGGLKDLDQVRGPLVNTLPVRVILEPAESLGSVVAQIHGEAKSIIPHQNLGFTRIIRKCTDWPAWVRFGSILAYQAAELPNYGFQIGDSDVKISHQGELGDSADLYVIATPSKRTNELQVEIRSAPGVLTAQEGEWIVKCFQSVLEAMTISPDLSIQDLRDNLTHATGHYIAPAARLCRGDAEAGTTLTLASTGMLDLVNTGWREVGLSTEESHPDRGIANARTTGNHGMNEPTMAECGADIISVLLLSKFYERHGQVASVRELLQYPTKSSQACLLSRQITS